MDGNLKAAAVVLAAMVLDVASGHAATVSLKEIREAGVVIQKWDTSCAAAALATVFTYTFNDPASEREVAGGLLRQTEPLRVRHRGGFSMRDMKRYAEERGYRATGFKGLTLADIRYFGAPIVPIRTNGYNHYVVLKRLTEDGRVHLADPAFGNRTVSRKKFEAIWLDGIAFVMTERTQ